MAGCKKINLSNRDELPSTNSLNSEYLNLIDKENQTKIKVDQIYESKKRYPVAKIYFAEDNILLINKLSTVGRFSLAEEAMIETKNAKMSKDIVYNTLKNGSCQFIYESDGIDSVSRIYLTFFGDSVRKVISNDSTLAYHLVCKNLSIRYNKNCPVDMLLEGQQRLLGFKEFSTIFYL